MQGKFKIDLIKEFRLLMTNQLSHSIQKAVFITFVAIGNLDETALYLRILPFIG